MTTFTRTLLVAIAALCLAGCACTKHTPTADQQNSSTNETLSTQFNEEHYIWESWIFPSNKTTGK